MKRIKRNGLIALAVIVLLFVRVRPAKGQFGGIPGVPTIVWDPTSTADILKDVAAAIQLNDMVQTAAIFFNGGWKYRWRGAVTQVLQQNVPNYYGETSGWNGALSYGQAPPMAWGNATMRFTPGTSVPSDFRQMARLSTVDVYDGAGVTAIQAVGQSNSDRSQVDTAMSTWEQSVLDESAGTNSQVQQLNLLTTGSALNMRYTQLNDNKLSALVQLQIAEAKQRRDQEAGSIQYMTDVETLSTVQGFGLGTCVSCTIRSPIP